MCQRGQNAELRYVEGDHDDARDAALSTAGDDWIQPRLADDELVTTWG